jgi:hypothetical protein
MQVQIVGATIENYLTIRLSLLNVSQTKKVTYRSWSDQTTLIGRDHATLKDSFGNSYTRTVTLLGANSRTVHPDKSVTDVLTFERPIDKASYLELELSASNYGCEGVICFRIPLISVEGSEANKQQALRRRAEEERKAAQVRAEEERRAAEEARRIAEEKRRLAEEAADAARKELAARRVKAQLDLLGLQDALKAALDEEAQVYAKRRQAYEAVSDAEKKAAQDYAAYEKQLNGLYHSTGESKRKDELRKECAEAKQRADESEKRANGLRADARDAADEAARASDAVGKARRAVQQAEATIQAMEK